MKLIILLYLGIVTTSSFYLFQDDSLEQSVERGKQVYGDFCITCHLDSGEGVPNVFPPLANSDFLLGKREASIRAVKHGQSGEITVNGTTYNSMMMDNGLTDEEVADVMNYILNSWGNSSDSMVTPGEVAGIAPE